MVGLSVTVIVCADSRGWNACLLHLLNHPLTLGANLSSFLSSLLHFNKIFIDGYYVKGYCSEHDKQGPIFF